MTQTICDIYELPMPISPEPISDEYWVEEEKLCALVERVFASNIALFYAWAQPAAGMYEIIKGETYEWRWSEPQTPLVPERTEWGHGVTMSFRPYYRGVEKPVSASGKVIGPPPPRF